MLSIDETESENLSTEAAVHPRQILQRPQAEAAERPPKQGRSVAAERPPNPKTLKAKEEKTSKKLDARQNWMNTVDPWSTRWIKLMADNTTDGRTLKHLKSFVHPSRQGEVTPKLVQQIRRLSLEEVQFSLREMQNKPKWVQRKCSTNSLETRGTIMGNDRSKIPVVALVDSGCSGSAIDETFVKENNILTYNLPLSIPVYNADGTMNSNGTISKFVTIEFCIGEHSERLALAVTKLSTHPVFLGYYWLKEHNPEIDWKAQTLKLTCSNDHLPKLGPIEDNEDEVDQYEDEERLF